MKKKRLSKLLFCYAFCFSVVCLYRKYSQNLLFRRAGKFYLLNNYRKETSGTNDTCISIAVQL